MTGMLRRQIAYFCKPNAHQGCSVLESSARGVGERLSNHLMVVFENDITRSRRPQFDNIYLPHFFDKSDKQA